DERARGEHPERYAGLRLPSRLGGHRARERVRDLVLRARRARRALRDELASLGPLFRRRVTRVRMASEMDSPVHLATERGMRMRRKHLAVAALAVACSGLVAWAAVAAAAPEKQQLTKVTLQLKWV